MIHDFAPWPFFADDECNAVQRALVSGKVNYWTGTECREFEKEYASYTGRKHAIALFNGSVALELALLAYDIGPGDEVIVTSRTFIASASSAVMRGAVPIVTDIDENSQNVTAATLAKKITSRTRAVICVHLAGWPCDMDPIMDLAKKHNLVVIEDCAQAHGARYKGRPVGSLGHIAAFSFCQDKIITTGGEGGMLVMDDEEIWKKCWAYKDHGKSYDAYYNQPHPPGFRWVHESFGTNWRMTEMQAVIGRAQLRKLDSWVEARRANAARLNEAFQNLSALRVTIPPAEIYHSYYKYYTFVRQERLKSGWSRDRILEEIAAAGVPCYSGSCSEIYLEKAFENPLHGVKIRPEERLPIARHLGESSLMLLVHPTLTKQNIDSTISIVTDVMKKASR